MAKSRRTVSVCREGIPAIEEPRFLVEADGKLYLTLALLEYDPKSTKISMEQMATIRGLQEHMGKGDKAKAVFFPADRMSDDVIAANMVGPGPSGPGRGGH